jgi:hypothetical protein
MHGIQMHVQPQEAGRVNFNGLVIRATAEDTFNALNPNNAYCEHLSLLLEDETSEHLER